MLSATTLSCFGFLVLVTVLLLNYWLIVEILTFGLYESCKSIILKCM
jgi:hypothetical protein